MFALDLPLNARPDRGRLWERHHSTCTGRVAARALARTAWLATPAAPTAQRATALLLWAWLSPALEGRWGRLRLLLAETWRHRIYAEPFLRRLRELGDIAFAFREEVYFRPRVELGPPWNTISTASCRLQEKFRCGPRVEQLNAALLRMVERTRPDAVIVFRGEQIFPSTLQAIRAMGALVAGYNNDDPFGRRHAPHVWRHFLANVPTFDHLFAYRQKNVADFHRLGAGRVTLLRSFYVRDDHFPIRDTAKDLDVSFIGHWENDNRTDHIAAILRESAIRFGLWGTYWLASPIAARLQERFGSIRPLGSPEYNLAINRSRISLVFLSVLNNDTYTRRCFEIPAAGGFMLAPHTEDLASLFQEGEEAEYFRSPDEMLDKIRFYLNHETARARIAQAGRQRLLRDGHEALDRARQMRDEIRQLV